MALGPEIICQGCGLALDPIQDLPNPIFHSSAECWAHYGVLAARTLVLDDLGFAHQHAVDAYSVQHIGSESKPITAVFALLGICLALEHGANGREVQLAHMKLAKTRREWPRLIPTTHSFETTIQDVLDADSPDLQRLLREWMKCSWGAWAHEHERIRALAWAL